MEAGKKMDSVLMNEIEQNFLTSFRSVMKKITSIWCELGISEEYQYGRARSAENYVLSCMEEMAESEVGLYNDILKRIENYAKELEELNRVLDVQPIIVDDSLVLLEKEKCMRSQLDELVQERHNRMKTFHELKNVQQKYGKMLSLPAYEISSKTGVPSKADLHELENHVKMLKDEHERRHRKFCLAKRELTTIMETTELTPETIFDRDVICYEDDKFLLSMENLKELEELVAKVKSIKSSLEKQKEDLMEKLIKLWDRVNISKEDRQDFLANHVDCRVSTMKSIKNEIERCEEIKKQNIKSYVEALHKELHDLWQKCHTSDYEQNQFSELYENEYSEDALNAYEAEVQKMEIFYKSIEGILKKIEKRQTLWDLMLQLESKATDPNRFVNRGGKLLQEERERKQLQKDLPKLECDLFKAIEDYEEQTGKRFLFEGINYQDFVKNQWEQRMDEKENEKMMRQKQRTLMIEHEVTMGTPVTKRPLTGFPKSAPSKMLKSNAGTSVFCTPRVNRLRKTPDTMNSTRSKSCRRIRASPRFALATKNIASVLAEQNRPKQSEELLDNTSYTDFAKELDRPSRSGLISTVLAPKKVLGGKVCSNRSRKSAGTAVRKSFRNLSRAPQNKLTPVRGKAGLPFII